MLVMIYQHWLTNVGNQYCFFFISPRFLPAIFDDFSKPMIVPKVINNAIPIEKSSNMAKICWKKNNIGYQCCLTITNIGLPMYQALGNALLCDHRYSAVWHYRINQPFSMLCEDSPAVYCARKFFCLNALRAYFSLLQ